MDSLCNNATQNFSRSIIEFDLGPYFSNYFDFVSFGITMLLTIMLCFGVKESTSFNSVFTCFNVSIVIFVIVVGVLNADFANWNISEDEAQKNNGGTGGFLPHGIPGLLAASASCFYFFVGFDAIATSGEEAKNPSKTIPLSIILCLTTVFIAYSGVSVVQTLMQPYYEPLILPAVFLKKGIIYAKWVVTVGGLAGLSASLIGAIYPLPRKCSLKF